MNAVLFVLLFRARLFISFFLCVFDCVSCHKRVIFSPFISLLKSRLEIEFEISFAVFFLHAIAARTNLWYAFDYYCARLLPNYECVMLVAHTLHR